MSTTETAAEFFARTDAENAAEALSAADAAYVAEQALEQQRDALRDLAEDDVDYRRLCRKAGISPV
jgi:hypothetical protein